MTSTRRALTVAVLSMLVACNGDDEQPRGGDPPPGDPGPPVIALEDLPNELGGMYCNIIDPLTRERYSRDRSSGCRHMPMD